MAFRESANCITTRANTSIRRTWATFRCARPSTTRFKAKLSRTKFEKHFGTNLDGTYLRVEIAQDTDGFWLEPHSDLGVKLFTMLLYTSKDPSHADLGTDIYDGEKRHFGRSPFESNAALVFVPSDITFHGFERRKINGVRTSVIINYVSNEWRAREQLAFPNQPISH